MRTAAGFKGSAAVRAGRTIALVKAGRPVSLTTSVVGKMVVGGAAETGTQRLSVITESSTAGSLRLEDVPVVGHLPSDGSTVTLRTPAAGRWVAMTTDGDARRLTVTAPSFTDTSGVVSTAWTVYTSTRWPSFCELIWKPALGCGDYASMTVSGTAGQAESAWGPTGDSLVLAVPEGVAGTVGVQLTKAAG